MMVPQQWPRRVHVLQQVGAFMPLGRNDLVEREGVAQQRFEGELEPLRPGAAASLLEFAA